MELSDKDLSGLDATGMEGLAQWRAAAARSPFPSPARCRPTCRRCASSNVRYLICPARLLVILLAGADCRRQIGLPDHRLGCGSDPRRRTGALYRRIWERQAVRAAAPRSRRPRQRQAARQSRLIAHLMRELSRRYPLWLCDVWGVIHDGQRSFADAVTALRNHRRDGGHVVLVTNAPRDCPAKSNASWRASAWMTPPMMR